MSARGGYTVSGPGIDRRSPDAGPALSLAITLAGKVAEGETVYVRDPQGNACGRVENHGHGHLHVYGRSR